MSKVSAFFSFIVALLVGSVGCHKPNGTVLGKAPKAPPATVLAIRAGDTPSVVSVTGVMIEKCPTAGCWFKLQDSTGTIMVDTKTSGFVVVNVPLESKVTVSGKILSEGNEFVLEASSVRY